MLGLAVLAVAVGVAGAVFSRVLVLDLVSLWPALVPAVAALPVGLLLRRRFPRVLALPPLLALTWLTLGVAAHLSGWPPLPSSTAELVGPPPPESRAAALQVSLDAALEVDVTPAAALYRVELIRRGGELGPPLATEQLRSDQLAVSLEPRSGGEWFRFAGWRVKLAREAVWDLQLQGDPLRADLEGLAVASLQVSGAGRVVLGSAAEETPVMAAGELSIEIPSDSPARVEGPAAVPATWEPSGGGWRAPVPGEGWVITVPEGSQVVVVQR